MLGYYAVQWTIVVVEGFPDEASTRRFGPLL